MVLILIGRNRESVNCIINETKRVSITRELTTRLENLGCFKRVSPTAAFIEST